MKKFLFVRFTNGTNDIVPRLWMVDETACKWPPTKDKSVNVERLARESTKPLPSWGTYGCSIQAGACEYALHKLCFLSELNIIYMYRNVNVFKYLA